MKFKLFGSLFLLIQFATASVTQKEQQKSSEAEIPKIVVDQTRLKRQNGYGMWNNGGGNFPMGNNWNGPNSNGYGGPQAPPPDDSIKGSVGTKEEKPAGENENQNQNNGQPNGEGQAPWWPNGNGPNGYNNGPNPNGNFPNGYNNGPNTFNGGNNNEKVDDGIKGSIGAAVEATKPPHPGNGYGYGNRFGNGYGNNNNFGFNRMAGGNGYGNSFGRPILPRGERFFKGRGQMRY